MTFVFAVFLPLLVVAVGILRVATSNGDNLAKILGWALVFLGGAKACRIPVVSDDWIDPALQKVTGVWNLTDFSGMFFAVCGGILFATFAARVVGRPSPAWAMPAGILVTFSIMLGTFLASPVADSPTSFMSKDFPMTGWFALYWATYLTSLSASALAITMFIFWAVQRFRPSRLRTAVQFFGAGAGMFGVYTLQKIIGLIELNYSTMGWYNKYSETVSMTTLLIGFTFLLACAGIAGWPVIGQWLHRWKLLRDRHEQWQRIAHDESGVVLDPSLIPADASAWQLLLAARTPVATHRLLVEMADAAPAPAVGSGS